MASRPKKKANNRTDITLMTLIANEATSPARKILKKYGEQDAKDYKDLEVKLAELYFKTDDKVALEKELAEIHPHRKWLMKHIEPTIIEIEIIKEVFLPCQHEEQKSNVSGDLPTIPVINTANNQNQMQISSVMGIIGVVAVVGILSLSIIHITKK
jgi:hypothetical protein